MNKTESIYSRYGCQCSVIECTEVIRRFPVQWNVLEEPIAPSIILHVMWWTHSWFYHRNRKICKKKTPNLDGKRMVRLTCFKTAVGWLKKIIKKIPLTNHDWVFWRIHQNGNNFNDYLIRYFWSNFRVCLLLLKESKLWNSFNHVKCCYIFSLFLSTIPFQASHMKPLSAVQ